MAELQTEIFRGGRRGVQPELAAAAPRDPVREARAVAREEHAEGPAVDRRERAGEAARPARRRRAAPLARARQAELDLPGGAAAARGPARRPGPHVVQPGGGGDRPAVVVEPEPAEHPGADRARPADPAGVRPGRRRGRCCCAADYSQIELRILAHLSGDEGLAEAFASGHDIHTATSARVFGLPEDQVDPSLRSRAKMINYGLAYGMNAFGLASRLGIAPDEAQEFMDAYFARFPKYPRVPRPAGGHGRPSRGTPRRCSGGGDTSPSCRRPTPGCATSGGGWR